MEQQETTRRIGLGAGFIEERSDILIPQIMGFSPQLALAIAKRVPFAPYYLNIRTAFLDATSTLNPVSFENGDSLSSISNPVIIDSIEYEITSPNFAGQVLKPVYDYFYSLNSGIQARLEVQGANRYTPAPFFTPLKALLHGLGEAWPHGWVLQYNQTISMQFQQTTPVPVTPTNICVTFRMWQPLGFDFTMMTAPEARSQLAALGWNVGDIIGPSFALPAGNGTPIVVGPGR